MSKRFESKTMIRSQWLFKRLLVIYPRAHREEYGRAMAQLFRDQSHDAWQKAGDWGLVALWSRVLPDLLKTSLLEHLASLKGRKSMLEKISEIFHSQSMPSRVFRGMFLAVFLLAFGGAIVITFILPESFASMARIKLQSEASAVAGSGAEKLAAYDPYFLQTQLEVIQSDAVLRMVADALDLTKAWGKRYAGADARFSTAEVIHLLRPRLDLRPVRNTSLVEIRVFSEDSKEAAMIANTVADSYRSYCLEQLRKTESSKISSLEEQAIAKDMEVASANEKLDRLRKEFNLPNPEPSAEELRARYPAYWQAKAELETVTAARKSLAVQLQSDLTDLSRPRAAPVVILDKAVPGREPVRPNKAMNIVFGMVTSVVLALILAGAAGLIAFLLGRKMRCREASA